MSKCQYSIAFVFSAVIAVQQAYATPLSGSATGLESPDQVITFDELPLDAGTLVTDQYAEFGVIFSPVLAYNPLNTDPWNIPENRVATFRDNENYLLIANPFDLNFTSEQTDAAFTLGTNTGTTVFTAFLGDELVESFSAETDLESESNFFGFTNSLFDRIMINAGDNGAAAINEIQFSGPVQVPAPTALMLLGFGLIGIGWSRRRVSGR